MLIHLPTGPVFPSCIFCYPTRFRKWGDTTNYHNSHWVRPCTIYPISLEICEISVDTLFHEVTKYGQNRFKPKISRLLQGKKLSTCSRVMKTTLIVENSTGLEVVSSDPAIALIAKQNFSCLVQYFSVLMFSVATCRQLSG